VGIAVNISIARATKDPIRIKKEILNIFHEQRFVPRGKVFLKPNLSGRHPIMEGENTAVYFMEGLVHALIDLGITNIQIGHFSLLGTKDKSYPFETIIKDSHYDTLLKFNEVSLVNLDDVEKRVLTFDNVSFTVPISPLDADTYINVAKLKTHMETTISLALKNQMGLIIGENRIDMHRFGLEERIAYLGKVVVPHFNLVDGIVGMDGNGPHHGNNREIGLIFGGRNLVEIDSQISFLMGQNPRDVEHLITAEKIGVGVISSKKEFNIIKKHKFDFEKARDYYPYGKKLKVWPTTSCSGCIMALNEAGREMKRDFRGLLKLIGAGYLGKNKNIVIGSGKKNLDFGDSERLIFIGACSKKMADKNKCDCLVKCPPSIVEVRQHLEDTL
jgi:uncharacterized protein (DUF362 family)